MFTDIKSWGRRLKLWKHFDRMRELGFNVNPNNRVVHNQNDEIEKYIERIYSSTRQASLAGSMESVEKVNDT